MKRKCWFTFCAIFSKTHLVTLVPAPIGDKIPGKFVSAVFKQTSDG
jgi:hypothetical protein